MPGVPCKWDGEDDESESVAEETETEDNDDEEEEESAESEEEEEPEPKRKGRASAPKAKTKAAPKVRGGKKPKTVKAKAKKRGPTNGGKARESRTSRKGDGQIFRYQSWRAVPESSFLSLTFFLFNPRTNYSFTDHMNKC